METYEMVAKCNNCGEEWIEEIPKGRSTERHRATCKNCGLHDIHYKRKVYNFRQYILDSICKTTGGFSMEPK